MALASQAQLLDELMGKNRNAGPGARMNQTRFDDEDVCKFFLVAFCPHDLFVNTRADLGICNRIHDEELKKQYEKSSRYGRLGYEEDFERFVRNLLNDVDRKIRRGVERLRLTQQNNEEALQNAPPEKREHIKQLREKINELIKEAERLGEEGQVEEAQAKLEESEKLKAEAKVFDPSRDDQKQMQVCEVCGSFLIVNDAQARIEEHISGKQHMGYSKLKAALEELKKKRQEEADKRYKERERRSSPDRRRGNDRDRDRDKRSRDRSSERRSSKRSPDRRRRSRSRDRSRSPRRRDDDDRRNSKHSSSSSSSHRHHRSNGDDDRKRKSSRSRSKSRERSNKSKNGKESKLEKEADEFLKQVDMITSKPSNKDAELPNNDNSNSNNNANDDDMDEGEIRG